MSDDCSLPVDRPLLIFDSARALRFADAHNIPAHLLLDGGLHPGNRVIIEEKHPTHWIMVGLYIGHAKAADNGLHFVALPKSRYTKESLLNQMRESLGDTRVEISKDPPRPST